MHLDLLWNEPQGEGARCTIVLAHGAGAPMDSADMTALAVGLAGAGLRVARFEFPYMQARRRGQRPGPDREPVLRQTWQQALALIGDPHQLVIGGKSMGGRIASMIADEAGVRGLVCFGYPFHPPGQPEKLRTAHLAQLKTKTLILQGTRDPFGTPDEVAGYSLSPQIRVAWIADGDHSFKPRRAAGRTTAQNVAEAVAQTRAFVAAL